MTVFTQKRFYRRGTGWKVAHLGRSHSFLTYFLQSKAVLAKNCFWIHFFGNFGKAAQLKIKPILATYFGNFFCGLPPTSTWWVWSTTKICKARTLSTVLCRAPFVFTFFVPCNGQWSIFNDLEFTFPESTNCWERFILSFPFLRGNLSTSIRKTCFLVNFW